MPASPATFRPYQPRVLATSATSATTLPRRRESLPIAVGGCCGGKRAAHPWITPAIAFALGRPAPLRILSPACDHRSVHRSRLLCENRCGKGTFQSKRSILNSMSFQYLVAVGGIRDTLDAVVVEHTVVIFATFATELRAKGSDTEGESCAARGSLPLHAVAPAMHEQAAAHTFSAASSTSICRKLLRVWPCFFSSAL
eukprot:COSAG01_NODE_2127_length_8365_cov_5.420276_10_plen_198_part_00